MVDMATAPLPYQNQSTEEISAEIGKEWKESTYNTKQVGTEYRSEDSTWKSV